MGVGERSGVEVGPADAVGECVGDGVEVKASIVACTIAAIVGLGVKTASSGGDKAYFIVDRKLEMRQSTFSRMIGI